MVHHPGPLIRIHEPKEFRSWHVPGKVTLLLGAGFYSRLLTTAQRLAKYHIFDEVVLTDIIEGRPEGLALDMNQSRPVEGFETKVTGGTTGPAGEGYEVIAGSGMGDRPTAGLPRKPGMSRMDLIEVNAKIVRNVVENIAVNYAPGRGADRGVQPAGRDDRAGRQGVPASPSPGDGPGRHARHRPVQPLRGLQQARRPGRLGAHPDPRIARRHHGPGALGLHGRRPAAGRPAAADEIEQLVTRTRNGGGEIVALLKTGSRTTPRPPPRPGWPAR